MQNNKKWIRKGDILKNIVRTISIITILLLIILFFLFLKDDIKKFVDADNDGACDNYADNQSGKNGQGRGVHNGCGLRSRHCK